MQEANVRVLDIRHTLPNLKALLLTLSSPYPPAPPSGSATYIGSQASSRATSHTFSIPQFTSPGSSMTRGGIDVTPASSVKRGGRDSPNSVSRLVGSVGTPSPLKAMERRSKSIRGSRKVVETDKGDEEDDIGEEGKVSVKDSEDRFSVISPFQS
jgi:hypothetical protein